ncbi:MAG: hypothetical protein WA126_05435 [Thermodesulfovibrionales bacterium]
MAWRDITIYGLLDLIARRWVRYELHCVADRLPKLKERTVLSGPFKSMRFNVSSELSEILPKLIGSYECELHEIFENLISKRFTTIINIGSSDGYYAVGMAIRCPQAQIIAFEMDKDMRNACINVAVINGVEARMTIIGKCDARSLDAFTLNGSLIIIDCEGAEVDILDEYNVPKLVNAWLLIELHDALRPGCGRTLLQRFEKSHDMLFISGTSRDPAKFAVLDGLRSRQKVIALDEKRLGVQEWVLMSPKG